MRLHRVGELFQGSLLQLHVLFRGAARPRVVRVRISLEPFGHLVLRRVGKKETTLTSETTAQLVEVFLVLIRLTFA